MACWDSYDVSDTWGGTLTNTAPEGWPGCGSCPCCLASGVKWKPLTPEMRAALSHAGRLARWLTEELWHGRISEEDVYSLLDWPQSEYLR